MKCLIVFTLVILTINFQYINCESGHNDIENVFSGVTKRLETDPMCEVIYDFQDLGFEDKRMSNNRKIGIFSDVLYDPTSSAIFLLSPYSTHAKVSYYLATDYKYPSRPRLKPYPSFDVNHMRCKGRSGKERIYNSFKDADGEYFISFSADIKEDNCSEEPWITSNPQPESTSATTPLTVSRPSIETSSEEDLLGSSENVDPNYVSTQKNNVSSSTSTPNTSPPTTRLPYRPSIPTESTTRLDGTSTASPDTSRSPSYTGTTRTTRPASSHKTTRSTSSPKTTKTTSSPITTKSTSLPKTTRSTTNPTKPTRSSTIPRKTTSKPKPHWPTTTRRRDKHYFVSIYSGYIDFCQRLWLLERGVWNGTRCSGPALYIYDITSEGRTEEIGRELIARIRINSDLYEDANGFQKIIVDSNKNDCDKAVAYLSNSFDNTLLVYHMSTNKMHLFEDSSFRSQPSETKVTVGRVPYTLKRGLHALAIGPHTSKYSRQILYTTDSSPLLYSITSQEANSNTINPSLIGNVGCKRKRSAHAYHLSLNVYFFADRQSGALYCASGNQFIYPRNVVKLYQDKENPDFPSTMHIDRKGNLLLMYSHIDRYEIGRIHRKDIRTTIVRCRSTAVRGTICDNNCDRRRSFDNQHIFNYTQEYIYEL